MTRICELTEKSVLTGNNVSHSKRKTRRRFLPNLQPITVRSDILQRFFKMRISTSALKSIEANGGFDTFILSTSNANLSPNARKIKKEIMNKLKEMQTQ
jgi:large subunit ribosomal protein L28